MAANTGDVQLEEQNLPNPNVVQDEQPNEANRRHELSCRQLIFWWCLFVSLMIFGTLFMLIDVGIALFCLHDHGYTTALCSVQSESFPAADELRLVAETTEPVISVLIVIFVMILTHRNQLSCSQCCLGIISWRKFVRFYWFSTYCITMLASFAYYIAVFAFNVRDHLEGSLRYLTLPLGMTSWFVWMVTLNESGATTRSNESGAPTRLNESGAPTRPNESGATPRQNESAATPRPNESGAPTRPNESGATTRPNESCATTRPNESGATTRPNESGATTTPTRLKFSEILSKRLYKALLIFAGMTNFVEFVIYTIYLAGTLTTVKDSLNLLPYLEIVGQSLVVYVRYGMASFYFQMLFTGKEGYPLLKDPWPNE